jgi:TonB family C-terminal domain
MLKNSERYYESSAARFQDRRFSADNFIALNLQYPLDAMKDSLSGVAHVRFLVNEDGEMSDFSVRPSLSPLLNKEAIRLVRMMPKVMPILVGNHYVPVYSFIPVRFNIHDYLSGRSVEVKMVSANRNEINRSHVYNMTEYKPSFPGGVTSMQEYIQKNIGYPSEVEKGEKQNVVDLKFEVDTTGKIQNISVLRSLIPSLDDAAIQVIKNMPGWTPAMINGKTVSSWVKVPVDFELNKTYPYTAVSKEFIEAESTTSSQFVIVEKMPEYPGGVQEMMKFLSLNVKYPMEEMKKGISGMEIVSFVVDTKGKIQDISVVRSIGPSFDEESIRVVNKMPRWVPGRQGGKDVSVKFTLPIKFALK